MYVCICNGITRDTLVTVIDDNQITCLTELKSFGVCDTCTRCLDPVLDILSECLDTRFKNEDWYIPSNSNTHWDIKI